MDELKAERFWDARASEYGLIPLESIVNFEEDPVLLKMKVEAEERCVFGRLRLRRNHHLLDLGAGVGQWSFRFARHVERVVAVEPSERLLSIARHEAAARSISNVHFVRCSAQNFMAERTFDIVFVSGLLTYLTDASADLVMRAIKSMSTFDGTVFVRDSTSVLPSRYLVTERPQALNGHRAYYSDYSAVYRTRDEIVRMVTGVGFRLIEDGQMYEEGCPLNKTPEKRTWFYVFGHER